MQISFAVGMRESNNFDVATCTDLTKCTTSHHALSSVWENTAKYLLVNNCEKKGFM